jgi:hypothetical protein
MTTPRVRRSSWARSVWDHQFGLQYAYATDVLLGAGLGLATLLGGWQRVSGPGWVTMRATGGPYLWGSVLLACALVLAVAPALGRQTMIWMLRCAAIVYGLAALWFFNAALASATVSFWGAGFSLYAMINQIFRANIYRTFAKQVR